MVDFVLGPSLTGRIVTFLKISLDSNVIGKDTRISKDVLKHHHNRKSKF